MSLLDDIADYLIASTSALTLVSGTAASGNVIKARMLDHSKVPDTVVGLYETAGMAPSWVFSTGTTSPAFETAGLQAIARSTSYETARGNAYRVYRILDDVAGQTLPTSTCTVVYQRIAAQGPPMSLGQDRAGRFLLSVNFDVMKDRS